MSKFKKLKTKNYKLKTNYIIGIDEVGRGALAGPVVVAALAAPTKLRIKNAELRIKKKPRNSVAAGSPKGLFLIFNSKLAKLRDSKKLSPKQREIWFQYITRNYADKYAELRGKSQCKPAIYWSVASVSPKVIDKINISKAANLAATRALSKLVKSFTIVKYLTKSKVEVFLDGGLYLNKIRVNPCLPAGRSVSNRRISASTITKGDEKIPAIMLASIVAKVMRDRMMVKLHKKYPRYAFDRHKGYGTKNHIKAIRKFGPTKVHRLAFLKKIRYYRSRTTRMSTRSFYR